MYNIRKVHQLLLEPPATTEKRHAETLKDFFFTLNGIDRDRVPQFCSDMFSVMLHARITKVSLTCPSLSPELPPHLIRTVIRAMAYAFSSEDGVFLVRSYAYVLGIDEVSGDQRPKKNDTSVLVGLFEVLCPEEGQPQPLGMSFSQYDRELTRLICTAFKKRHFSGIMTSSSDRADLSSALKRYFTCANSKTDGKGNIETVIKSIHELIGDKGILWGSAEEDSLEHAFASEFSFKAFSCYKPEDRVRMLKALIA